MAGRYRSKVIELAKSWIGKNPFDGSHHEIIDLYNSQKVLPRGVRMTYEMPWCAATVGALAIKLGYTDIIPVECSCDQLIKQAIDKGIWQEDDGYIPSPADIIVYDWDDTGKGDNKGWPDHVGFVVYVNQAAGYFTTLEGNRGNYVKEVNVQINSRYIRGFICPKYDGEPVSSYKKKKESGKDLDVIVQEVISGLWGNYPKRKEDLEAYGYNYEIIRNMVNIELMPKSYQRKVAEAKPVSKDSNYVGSFRTISDLNMRSGPGTNKEAMIVIPKGTTVQCNGEYTRYNGVIWLYVTWIRDTESYTGFSSLNYLN